MMGVRSFCLLLVLGLAASLARADAGLTVEQAGSAQARMQELSDLMVAR